MEFAKYYNVTKLVDDMQKKEEIDSHIPHGMCE